MSDESVWAALRSPEQLVVVEAPGGCGKTHQGAEYACEIANSALLGRPLILTHTHAACSVFAERTKGTRVRVAIRTIDSVIGQIASAYHAGLGLPADTGAWVREQGGTGHQALALMVSRLLERRPMIAAALARRHTVVICDEHQDSNGDQHAAVMALLDQGARLRVFADPMQKIFRDKTLDGSAPACDWEALCTTAQSFEKLDYPHRWDAGCPLLGQWTLRARETLKAERRIDLRNDLPPSLTITYAENMAQAKLDLRFESQHRKPIDLFTQERSSLLILTRYNETAQSLRAFFGRRILLWEGHTRPGLDKLVRAVNVASGDPSALARAVVTFMGDVGKGFSPSAFGDAFVQEVREACVKVRKGKPALVQELARLLVSDPSHRGVARVLERVLELKADEPAFKSVEIDCYRELWDAIRLGTFETPDAGVAEIAHRHAHTRPKLPDRAISTIHKAKGLECDSVIVMPCDSKTFPDRPDVRCLLYVALSRARKSLMLVVSRSSPSPLFII